MIGLFVSMVGFSSSLCLGSIDRLRTLVGNDGSVVACSESGAWIWLASGPSLLPLMNSSTNGLVGILGSGLGAGWFFNLTNVRSSHQHSYLIRLILRPFSSVNKSVLFQLGTIY